MYTYLIINILTIFIPLLLSFEKKVHFVTKWKHVFPALLLTSILFIVWDYFFTSWGVWGFNKKYLMGIFMGNLPLEEILFFLCIPFSCVFIYEVVRYGMRNQPTPIIARPVLIIMGGICVFIGLWHVDKIYTAVTFLAVGLLILWHALINKSDFLGYFFQMYLISLIPFLAVNGVLTGGIKFIDPGPVVWYNNAENLSLRVMNIPVEDFMYSMLLLLLTVSFYEFFKKTANQEEESQNII